MERIKFLKSLFAVVVAAAVKDLSILKLGDGVCDIPGINPNPLKIRLHKSWFVPGDIVRFGNYPGYGFLFREREDGAVFIKVPGFGKDAMEIDVEFIDSEDEKHKVEHTAMKLCSLIEEI